MPDPRDIVSLRWSRQEPGLNEPNFYSSPVTRPLHVETAFGAEYVEIYRDNPYFAEDYFIEHVLSGRTIRDMLSLCCGYGLSERYYARKLPSLRSCLGLDLASGAIEGARQRAAEVGMSQLAYGVADLNEHAWPHEAYDLIVANGALHHLRNLESVCPGLRRALRPGGVLLATEYVGPAYQDHSPRQLELINSAAFLVPPELRARQAVNLPFRESLPVQTLARLYGAASRPERPEWSPLKKGLAKACRVLLRGQAERLRFAPLHVSPKRMLLKTDPSECVRSDEVIPSLEAAFGEVKVFPMGGGILQHALDERFYTGFDPSSPLHGAVLELLHGMERKLMDLGEIGIENAFIVAVKTVA